MPYHYPQSDSESEYPELNEETQLSGNYLGQNLNLITESAYATRDKRRISVADLVTLPAYPPCLPLSTDPIDPRNKSVDQCPKAIKLGLEYAAEPATLPNITMDNWELDGQEQLYLLLPKYLFTNSIIILQVAGDITIQLKNPGNTRTFNQLYDESWLEILQIVKTLENLCIDLQKKGKQIIAFIRLGKKIKSELDYLKTHGSSEEIEQKEQELKDTYQHVQKLRGQLGTVTLTESYSYQLKLLHPFLEKILEYYQGFEDQVNQLNETFIVTETPPSSPH